jgi:hypothetical protein
MTGPRTRRVALLLVLGGLAWWAAGTACGHVVRHEFAPNHAGDFDLERPPCGPGPAPAPRPGTVNLRYLGASGLYVGWQGHGILLGPFFSIANLPRVVAGRLEWDREAIRRGLADLPVDGVVAVLAGHSHYDHLLDLPIVAREHAPRARLWVNRSGARMLAAFPELGPRVATFEEHEGRWTPIDPRRPEVPIRILPLPSRHTPHVDSWVWAGGEVAEEWRGSSWEERRLAEMKSGRVYALVLDLLEPGSGRVAFRIYYQDAATGRGVGEPPAARPDEPPYDLAVLCMASYMFAPGAPGALLDGLRPRHVVVTHYEDFFRPRERPLRFVVPLSDSRVDRYFRAVRDALERGGQERRGPQPPPACGPSTDGWTLPLPGEWLTFSPATRVLQ